jgi:DNA polymerase-4
MDLDTFFVSCERLRNKELDGKPVLIGSDTLRGVVSSCSYEARTFGIHSAMPMKHAKRLCPDAIIIASDSKFYGECSKLVTDIIRDEAPLFQKSSIDEFYIDMTGMEQYFGTYKWAKKLRARIIKETGLPISFGLASCKVVAKVATGEGKPNGEMYIKHGEEKAFLAPLPIRKIPMIGKKTAEVLYSKGIKIVKDIQDVPQALIEQQLGKNGIGIWKKCQGIDNSKIIPQQDRKSISSEMTFEHDTVDMKKLGDIIIGMTENLAFQLRKTTKQASCVTFKLRYANMETFTMQKQISFTSCDSVLIKVARELFLELYHSYRPVRLIGVGLSNFIEGGHQINLFEDTENNINLTQAMDNIKKRYGMKAVTRSVSIGARNFGSVNPFTGTVR